MVAVVLAPKLSLGGSSKLGRLEEFLSLLLIAPKPALAVTISRFERPRQVLDLDQLSEKRCRSIPTTINKQIRTC
jgi:hypothetical protein